MGSKPKSPLEDWLPHHPLRWAGGFAVLYVGLFLVQQLLTASLVVVSGRIDLVFLPAFARIASVLVAGLAGVAGIAVGSFFMNLFFNEQPVGFAIWLSIASAAGILLSYGVVRIALNTKAPEFTLPMLVVLTVLYGAFNAMIHGLTWELLGVDQPITTNDLALMMIGDLAGVMLMFAAIRVLSRVLPLIKKPLND